MKAVEKEARDNDSTEMLSPKERNPAVSRPQSSAMIPDVSVFVMLLLQPV